MKSPQNQGRRRILSAAVDAVAVAGDAVKKADEAADLANRCLARTEKIDTQYTTFSNAVNSQFVELAGAADDETRRIDQCLTDVANAAAARCEALERDAVDFERRIVALSTRIRHLEQRTLAARWRRLVTWLRHVDDHDADVTTARAI